MIGSAINSSRQQGYMGGWRTPINKSGPLAKHFLSRCTRLSPRRLLVSNVENVSLFHCWWMIAERNDSCDYSSKEQKLIEMLAYCLCWFRLQSIVGVKRAQDMSKCANPVSQLNRMKTQSFDGIEPILLFNPNITRCNRVWYVYCQINID